MGTAAKVATIIALTGMLTTLVLPGRTTAAVSTSFFNGVSQWTKTAQGRG